MIGRNWRGWLSSLMVFGSVSVLIAVCLAPFGETPLEGIQVLLDGAFGSLRRLSESCVKTSPLLFTGLAVAVAFRTGAFNIGAEGQFILGGLGAVTASLFLGNAPAWISLPTLLLAGFLGGALWGGIAGVLRAWRGVPEVLSTILLNFIAIYWMSALIRGPLRNTASGLPESPEIPELAAVPRLFEGLRVHAGLVIGIALAIGLHLLLTRTTYGFRMRAVGFNPDASLYAGFKPKRTLAFSLILSGALAGLGGAVEVGAITFRLFDNFSSGYGYTAIAVALLARLHPIGVIFTAFFFGALEQGAGTLQRELSVPLVMVSIVQGLVILLALLLGYHRPGEKAASPEEEPT